MLKVCIRFHVYVCLIGAVDEYFCNEKFYHKEDNNSQSKIKRMIVNQTFVSKELDIFSLYMFVYLIKRLECAKQVGGL
jgi:hypothetical protein